ncbi:MAG: response regulator transcription factor [Solirubrobacteraceae bacterium]
MNAAGATVVVFGDTLRNKSIVDELLLDGFDTRKAPNQEFLRMCCRPGDVELVIFGGGRDATSLGVLRELRAGALAPAVSRTMRVLWVAQGDTEGDVLRAFDAGSDDVMREPVHPRELFARITALARRSPAHVGDGMLSHHGLVIDPQTRSVTFHSRPVVLRRMEYSLLLCLARCPRRVFTKSELLSDVWGYKAIGNTRTVDSHASRLRSKLAAVGAEGWIVNARGVGYSLCSAVPMGEQSPVRAA